MQKIHHSNPSAPVARAARRPGWLALLWLPLLAWGQAGATQALEGTVEAVKQTAIAAQVAGAVVSLSVKAGDSVRAGQELLRLDAQSAQQLARASSAQVAAAQANLDVAAKDLARQRQLLQLQYISQAALDKSLAQHQAAQAQLQALQAQADAAQTQSGLFVIRAPYTGVVGDVPVSLGDMALPGKPLMTLHDPSSLRVTVAVPQGGLTPTPPLETIRIELPGLGESQRAIVPTQAQWLPLADPATHTVTLRLSLPAQASSAGARPGLFARVWFPSARPANRIYIPSSAVVRRAELTAVYVQGTAGQKPMLRQVRLGPTDGSRVEVLSGLSAQDQVVTQPTTTPR